MLTEKNGLLLGALLFFLNIEYTLSVDDPFFTEQWMFHNTGQVGVADVDINAPQAWEITRGSKDVLIGVIDSGVDINHADLKGNIWTNPGEIPGNLVDDDNNGFVDDVHGINGVINDGESGDISPLYFHGTAMNSAIGALADEQGIIGLAPEVSLVNCRSVELVYGLVVSQAQSLINCLDYFIALKKQGYYIPAVVYAISSSAVAVLGETVLEVPDEYRYDSPQVIAAVNRAAEEDILLITVAGNLATDNDDSSGGITVDGEQRVYPDNAFIHYPASLDLPNILSVAAFDCFGKLWFDEDYKGSGYGYSSIDVAAPGVSTLVAVHNDFSGSPVHSDSPCKPNEQSEAYFQDNYVSGDGTSQATAYTGGLVALIAAQYPQYSFIEIKNLIMSSGVDLDNDDRLKILSGKRIRAADDNGRGALTCNNRVLLKPMLKQRAGVNILEVLHINCAQANGPLSAAIVDASGKEVGNIILRDNGLDSDLMAGDGVYTAILGNW